VGNIWQNAALRTGVYLMLTPARWSTRAFCVREERNPAAHICNLLAMRCSGRVPLASIVSRIRR